MLKIRTILSVFLFSSLSGCGGQSAGDLASGKSTLHMPGGVRISGFQSPGVIYEKRNSKNQRNLRGSPYDQGVQIGKTRVPGHQYSGFSTHLKTSNLSLTDAPGFYRQTRKVIPVIRKALIANGLWYNKSTGLLSKAPYEISVSIIDYYDERYIQDKNVAWRAVDFLGNQDTRRYTKEILAQGFYTIRASYHIQLIDRATSEIVYTKKLSTTRKIKVYEDSNWNIHEGRKVSPHEMMRSALQKAFDEFLPART